MMDILDSIKDSIMYLGKLDDPPCSLTSVLWQWSTGTSIREMQWPLTGFEEAPNKIPLQGALQKIGRWEKVGTDKSTG